MSRVSPADPYPSITLISQIQTDNNLPDFEHRIHPGKKIQPDDLNGSVGFRPLTLRARDCGTVLSNHQIDYEVPKVSVFIPILRGLVSGNQVVLKNFS